MLYLLLLCQIRGINSMSRCLGPQRGATQYHAQLELPDKGLVIKGLVVCNDWESIAFGPAKWSGPRLLTTGLRGI